jgi:xanthine dehydrogenase small subunit
MNDTARDYSVFTINGQPHTVRGQQGFMMLADFLRYELRLCGTKIVCAEGDCGACTVLCYRSNQAKTPTFMPINSCIITMAQLDGCHIVTVEAIKQNGKLSPVQQAIVDHHGSQCGYCTPGFVMAMTAMFEKPKALTEQKVKNCLTGNLCRCTGYQPLINAALSIDSATLIPLSQQLTLPDLTHELMRETHIKSQQQEVFAPTRLDDAANYKQKNPHAGFLGGATDLGVSINKGKSTPQKYLSLHLIRELYDITEVDGRIIIGTRANLGDVRRFVKSRCPELASFIDVFASPQIKNMATAVGNIANASPIGDTIPFFLVTDGKVHAYSVVGGRQIDMNSFYKGYKITALKPEELITHVSFMVPKPQQKLKLEKVSQRRDLDISTVNAAFLFEMPDNNSAIQHAKLAFGGVDAVPKRMLETEQFLMGKTLSTQVINQACALIQKEISPLNDLRGSATFRRALADGLFRKYCQEMQTA